MYERSRRKYVPHIMQAWSVTVRYAAQSDLPGQAIESSVNLTIAQPIATVGNE